MSEETSNQAREFIYKDACFGIRKSRNGFVAIKFRELEFLKHVQVRHSCY